MKCSHVRDHLSAYIDGQIRDPETIARHLRSCPACAQHHLELLRISEQIGALGPPEHDPDFAMRVVARAGEAPSRWRLRGTLPVPRLAWAAAALVVLAAGLWHWLPGDTSGRSAALRLEPTPQRDALSQDDEHLVATFQHLMDAGVELDVFADTDVGADMALYGGLPDAEAEPVDADSRAMADLAVLLSALSDEEIRLLDKTLTADESEI